MTPEDGPVLLPSDGQPYTNPGAIVDEGTALHVFRNSFTGFGGPSVTDRLVSTDGGRTWDETSGGPVLSTADVPFTEQGSVFVRSVVADEGGGWLAYFYVFEGGARPGVIGLATAPAIDGPWSVVSAPVLEPGPKGAWDDRRVGEPAVLRRGGGYEMWFAGAGTDGGDAIGYATSVDGHRWVKHDDPTTGDDRLAESDPVLVGEGGWNDGDVGDPSVVELSDGLLLFYDNVDGTPNGIGLATSRDGVAWEPHTGNPLVTPATLGRPTLYQFEAVATPEGVRLFVEAAADPGTAIFPVSIGLRSVSASPALEASATVDGDGTATVDVEVRGFEVAFEPSDTTGRTGHVHVYVDRDPPMAGEAVPLGEPDIIHRVGTTVEVRDLAPGEHVLWVVIADGRDRALIPPEPRRLLVEVPAPSD